MPPTLAPVAHPVPIGRDTEIATVAQVLCATGESGTLLVTGGAGSGKTTVLEAARSAAVRDGVRVLRLPVPAAAFRGPVGGEGTAVAAGPLADAVCGLLAAIRGPRLAARVNAVRRARARLVEDGAENSPAPGANSRTSPAALAVLAALGEALATAAHRSPLALVVDGVERLSPTTVAALTLLLRAFRPADLPVVLTAAPPYAPGHRPAHHEDGGTPLLAAVDQVLDLPPLTPRAVAALVERRLGRPAERELGEAVTHDLGTLAGNPQALLALLAGLTHLPEVDGRLGPPEPIATGTGLLPVTTNAAALIRLGLRDHPHPAPALTAAAAALAHLTHRAELLLPDLHRLTAAGTPAPQAVDALFRSGVLTLDRDRGGRVAFAVPALATALMTLPPSGHPPHSDRLPHPDHPDHPDHPVPALHAAVVRSQADRLGPAGAGTSHPRLADHVAAAGRTLEDATAVPLLLSAARKDTRADQPRALRAYTSALDRLPPDDPRTPDVLRRAAALGLAHAAHAEVLALEEPLRAALATTPRSHPESTESLHFAAQAWTLAALHEHTLPADPPGPGALTAELLAVAGRYGIGPENSPAPDPTVTAPPLPTPPELRLLAAATGNRAAWDRARRALSQAAPDRAAELRLRVAASYGDLTGGLRAVLGDRYLATGDSPAARHHAMVLAYHAGDWDTALATARRIEARARTSATGHPAVRALAAEMHCFRGDLARARSWLELVPDTVTHPLAARARLTVRSWSGRADEALEGAWQDLARAREADTGPAAGTERLLLRILRFTLDRESDGNPDFDGPQARRVVRELAALHDETGSPLVYEALLLARAVVHRDAESARAAHASASGRGDIPLALDCSRVLAEFDTDPKPWLAGIARETARLGIAGPARAHLSGTTHRNGMPRPRRRQVGPGLSEQDVRLITMIGEGATNRQIAARLACSEKTVEQRLTRLFRRTGRRSRVELTTAWLDGALTPPQDADESSA